MNEKIRIKIKIILSTVCILIIASIFISQITKDSSEKEEDFITINEIIRMLSFIPDSEELLRPGPDESGDSPVTYSKISDFLETLDLYEVLKKEVEHKNQNKKVKIADWLDLYDKIVAVADSAGSISNQEILILGSSSSIEGLNQNEIYTDQGLYRYENMDLEAYKTQCVYAVVKENEILFIRKTLKKEKTLENVWIKKDLENGFQIFIDGYTIDLYNKKLSTPVAGNVADVRIKNKKITELRIKEEKISGKILAIHEDGIEIEGYGKVPLSSNFKVYKVYGNLEQQTLKDLVVGYHITEFVVGEGTLCSALVNSSITMENIRVLIKNNDTGDIFHNEVALTATTDFTIHYGENQEVHSAGEEIVFNNDSPYFTESRIAIRPNTLSGEIILSSVERSQGVPSYRGSFEIVKDPSGFVLINDILLEEYLYAVVPSEMPENYGIEALKAQAVCARSYAYNQLLQNSYPEYGAHVDDSVSFQVYNNFEENPTAIQAVKDTYGQVAFYNDKVIEAYYFSTSCGYTTTGDVWGGSIEEGVNYLQGTMVSPQKVELDLTQEETFRNFITSTEYSPYEEEEGWYRWSAAVDLGSLSNALNSKLSSRYKANPALLLVKDENGNYVSKPISNIGTITNITVGKRNTGGVIHELIVEGSKHTIKIITEYNIRYLLASDSCEIIKKDGSSSKGGSMLPSGYFILEIRNNGEDNKAVHITGGGYGHGVGMSQNAAKSMTGKGMGYEDVLKFFYSGIEIKNIYEQIM